MNMRPSRVLRKLRAGEVALCFKLNLTDARAAEIAAMAGFDCIWPDLEHVPNDYRSLESQVWAAKTQDADVMVRVMRGSYSDYIRPLEMDAAGIMVPHLMSAEDARNVARTTRFRPLGRRPVDGGNADGAYCGVPFADYLAQANRERFVAVQIEDPEPLAELDDIAATPGIDMLFFGPGDFTHSIGAPGAFDDPRVTDARQRVVEAALKHGKFAGTVGGLSNLESLIGMGYRFISLGADVIALWNCCKELMAGARKVPVPPIAGLYSGR